MVRVIQQEVVRLNLSPGLWPTALADAPRVVPHGFTWIPSSGISG